MNQGDAGGLWEPSGPIPSHGSLWHIGVHKTGTSALQAALAAARPELKGQGVLYPGTSRAHHRAALAVVGKRWGWQGSDAVLHGMAEFTSVIDEVRAWPGRSIVSSEHLCEADNAAARRVVDAVGADRLDVVVTLRPLGALLASSWQQYLKYGIRRSYESWLRQVLSQPPGSATPSFWARNAHAELVERWAGLVGSDRVTLVVLHDAPRDTVFRVFARMLAVDDELLLRHSGLTTNRSLTRPETELLLALNKRVRKGLSWSQYEALVRNGWVRELVETRVPPADEPRIATPDWALDAAAERGSADVERIRALGVRVIGDLESLGERMPSEPAVPAGDRIPVALAADGLAAAVLQLAAAAEEAQGSRSRGSQTRRAVRRWRRAVTQRMRRPAT